MHINNTQFFFHKKKFVDFAHNKVVTYAKKLGHDGQAEIHFSISGDKAISIIKGSFGSIHYNGGLKGEQIEVFISEFLNQLKQLSISEVIIKSFPACYDRQKFKIINKCYDKLEFLTLKTDITQYLDLNHDFIENINSAERRYLNYANKNDFEFQRLTQNQLTKAYELIVQSRLDKGYPVTMPLKDLKMSFSIFPDHYYLFGVFHQESLIATAVCIRINSKILYTFYLGDDLTYRKHSPIVFLLKEVYDWGKLKGYKILDLGISTENGVKNKGLYNFKRNLGAQPSEKPTYTISLDSM